MDTIAGFPFFPLEIDRRGKVFDKGHLKAIVNAVSDPGNKITDLFVVSHGWNNDMADARKLYKDLFTNVSALLKPKQDRKFAIVGVFWPSKKFADADLIPAGGVASIGMVAAGVGSASLPAGKVKTKLNKLKGFFDKGDAAALAKAKQLVDKLESSKAAQKQFVDLLRKMVPPKPQDNKDDASDKFFKMDGDKLLEALSAPVLPPSPPPGSSGGAASLSIGNSQDQAAGLGDIFSGITAGASRLLNYLTYYQMKERAGMVGGGLNGALNEVRKKRKDLNLHLIGHSFGARVVTAAVDGSAKLAPTSLVLLQAAFSHNGFTEKFDGTNNGFFRKVISGSKVNGPIAITHTVNDHAVGIAYPLASRISGDQAAALGDANDVFGGLGRNGAVKMTTSERTSGTLLNHTGKYTLVAKKVHNLQADAFIRDHNDVAGREVANLVLAAAGA